MPGGLQPGGLRIGLVIYGSLETLSGGYLYDRRLVEYLRAQGDQVEILSQPWGPYATRLWQNTSSDLPNRLAGLKLDLLVEDELNHPSLFLLNRRLRAAVGCPVVSIVHHLRSSEAHPAGLLALYRQVERRYLQTVQGFVFNSLTTRRAVENLLSGPVSGVVATPGGDRFGDGLSETAIHARAERPGPLRLLFVGNLIERKGLHTLIEALALMRGEDWLLHVVGQKDVDPRYTARVEALIRERGLTGRVFLIGKLEEEHLRNEWKRCHVLVVPSQYEGFGIVYLEGMSFGVPAIASTAGAAGEIITEGENGFLVPPGDASALAGRLTRLARDRALLERMALAARRRFLTFPTWEQSAVKIREYFLSITA